LILSISELDFLYLQIFVSIECCLTASLLFLECREKQGLLSENYPKLAPEEAGSILNRVFFWWINSILLQGNGKVLKGEDLPSIDRKLLSEPLRRAILQQWNRRGTKTPLTTTLPA
jgi:hypothetical protein